MKKWKRWLVLALATVLCLSLCGCDDLDTMRAKHAVWQEDGSILWNGAVYRKLENVEEMDKLDASYDYLTIWITEADVPVLLSDWVGESFDVCADGTMLKNYDYRLAEPEYVWYCREDVYDDVVKKLEGGIRLNTYFYYYYDWQREESAKYYLTAEQTDTIHRVLTTVTPVPIDEFDDLIVDDLYLYICDESHRFEQDTDKWLGVTESRYCIESYDTIYVVPLEYSAIFAEIWKAYGEGKYVLENPPSMVI